MAARQREDWRDFNGLHALAFGSLIVAFHNTRHGLPIVLILVGWAQVVKGVLNLVVPALGLRMLEHVRSERAWEF